MLEHIRRLFRVTTCGESYSGGFRKNLPIPPELYGGQMVIVDGVPPGLKITAEIIEEELEKRRPGLSNSVRPEGRRTGIHILGSNGK